MRSLVIEPSITAKTEHSLKCYLNDIAQIELINPTQEAELAKKMKEGDLAAKAKLIKANLRFVVSCAKKYQHMGLPLGDLINEGNIGLLNAANTFDETKGFRFISYAVWSIRQSIMMALSFNVRMIRLPMNMIRASSEVRQTTDKLAQLLEREPTAEEVCEELAVGLEVVQMNHAFNKAVDSLDANVEGKEGAHLWSFLEDESCGATDEIVMKESLVIEAKRILAILSEKERIILGAFYGLTETMPKSLDEIGAELQLSGERIRQLKDQALKKIKQKIAQVKSGAKKPIHHCF